MFWKTRNVLGAPVATCLVILSCERNARFVGSVPEMAKILERSRYRRY